MGMMIAAKLAMVSHNPFTYMISSKNAEHYGKHDKQVNVRDKRIIIVTDVIVTGETVNNIIEDLKKEYNVDDERIEKILTIFRRQPIKSKNFKKTTMKNHLNTMEEKINSLNNEFDIELCLKEQCIFKDNNICICKNERV